MTAIKKYPLLSYFLLAYLLSWSLEVPMALTARGIINVHLPFWLEALAGFGPFAAAVIVLKITEGSGGVRRLLDSLLRWRVPGIWLLATVLSPFAVLFAALAITGETDKFFSGELIGQLSTEGKLLELILIGGVLRGIGEEPGWRGLALPLLRGRYGPLLATLLLWPVWTCWHLPSFLLRPEFAVGAWVGFAVGILAATAWTTLLYDKTRSVLMIAIWHALINITRGIAGSASTEAFFAFAQAMLAIGLCVIIYWLFVRPGPYVAADIAE